MLRKLQSLLDVLFYTHVTPIIKTGRSKILDAKDLPVIPRSMDPRFVAPEFATLHLDSPWRFLFDVLTAMRRRTTIMAILILLCAGAGLLAPYLIHELISYVAQGQSATVSRGIMLAAFLCIAAIVEGLLFQHYVFHAVNGMISIVNGLNDRIYRQTLVLTRKSRQATPTGEVVNYMGTDSDQVAEFPSALVEAAHCVVLIIGATAMLFNYLGVSAVAAVVILGALSPLSKRIAKRFTALDDEIMNHRDKRVAQISQILVGIRIVKYFAWGGRVLDDIRSMRGAELDARRRMIITRAMSVLIYFCANTLVCIATFGVHLWLGRTLDAATVFACIALFGLLEHPMGNMTYLVSFLATAKVSAGRISGYLKEETLALDMRPVSAPSHPVGVAILGLNARYAGAENAALTDLSLKVSSGESIAVVGPVGSGKTSLLLALLGEIPVESGTFTWSGISASEAPRMAFVPQEAFVQNGTLRSNVLFGEPEDDLSSAVHAAALGPDLAMLKGGIDTEIGEHGVNLSGGQKQRVALARAVMAKPGLVLLDDPLSAVDGRTEDHLVNQLIFGHWKNVTRIVVTHRLQHLQRFDRVVFVVDGKILADGPFQEILAKYARFAEFMAEHGEASSHAAPALDDDKTDFSVVSIQKPESRITEDEDREIGAVKLKVYVDYMKALGGETERERKRYLPLLIGATLAITILPMLQNLWLSHWTNDEAAMAAPWSSLVIFAALGLVVLAAFCGQQLLWGLRSISAGRNLHDNALKAVLGAPLRFFDSTPVGRILNRFSRDVDAAERSLPQSFEQTVKATFYTVGSAVLLVAVLPPIIVVVAPVIYMFHRLQTSYRASSREAQRLMSISRSPRFALFKETLAGLTVIRGAHKNELFLARYKDALSENQRMFHGVVLLNRWFSIRVPLIGALVSFAVAGGVIIAARYGWLAAGTAGLALTYAVRFWEHLNWCVRTFAEVESRMTSVERLKHYAQVAQEPEVTIPQVLADDEPWPVTGEIRFENVTARYADHLPDVLKDFTAHVPAGAKVGLIGRTGSGKSTVLQVLFRFIAVRRGRILIDGLDIAGIPLARLRRSLAIIPQDPTLFKGTLRENLDRFKQHDDDAIWGALRRAHLESFVKTLLNGLDADVKENGHNFSQGQRQLFCLARALLVDARIIVMDEATASVDVETDALIQDAIRRECAGRTLLIIAHRLGTVEDCDFVIELSDGRVVGEPIDSKWVGETTSSDADRVSVGAWTSASRRAATDGPTRRLVVTNS